MRTLLMVHGVGWKGETGPWQKPVEEIIGPHFKCRNVRYLQYRWWGLVWALLEPYAFPAGMIVAFLLWWRGVISQTLMAYILVPLSIITLAWATTWVRRSLAVTDLAEQANKIAFAPTPHIIAHSMGSRLLGDAFLKKGLLASRIILAGCVLPVDFRWDVVLDKNPKAFNHIRNEVAQADKLPIMAEKLNQILLLRGFGAAGSKGFLNRDGLVHSAKNPYVNCPHCDSKMFSPSVHNFDSPIDHSGALTPSYASRVLLPWLWGFEPEDYEKWLMCCWTAFGHFTNEEWHALGEVEEVLLGWHWKWISVQDDLDAFPFQRPPLQKETLAEYISRMGAAHPKHIRNPRPFSAKEILRYTYFEVEKAREAHHNRVGEWQISILSLNPRIAVQKAINKFFQREAR